MYCTRALFKMTLHRRIIFNQWPYDRLSYVTACFAILSLVKKSISKYPPKFICTCTRRTCFHFSSPFHHFSVLLLPYFMRNAWLFVADYLGQKGSVCQKPTNPARPSSLSFQSYRMFFFTSWWHLMLHNLTSCQAISIKQVSEPKGTDWQVVILQQGSHFAKKCIYKWKDCVI